MKVVAKHAKCQGVLRGACQRGELTSAHGQLREYSKNVDAPMIFACYAHLREYPKNGDGPVFSPTISIFRIHLRPTLKAWDEDVTRCEN